MLLFLDIGTGHGGWFGLSDRVHVRAVWEGGSDVYTRSIQYGGMSVRDIPSPWLSHCKPLRGTCNSHNSVSGSESPRSPIAMALSLRAIAGYMQLTCVIDQLLHATRVADACNQGAGHQTKAVPRSIVGLW
jgi:hypothetical protein